MRISLEAEWTPGLLSADRRNRSLEHFQGPRREPNPRPVFLWLSASTKCATRREVAGSISCGVLRSVPQRTAPRLASGGRAYLTIVTILSVT
jgi:hypothetical protein